MDALSDKTQREFHRMVQKFHTEGAFHGGVHSVYFSLERTLSPINDLLYLGLQDCVGSTLRGLEGEVWTL